MAEQSDAEKLESVNPSLSKHTVRYLKRLCRTGIHGKTVGAVARTLIQDQIKYLVHKGILQVEFAKGPIEGDEDEEG